MRAFVSASWDLVLLEQNDTQMKVPLRQEWVGWGLVKEIVNTAGVEQGSPMLSPPGGPDQAEPERSAGSE